MTTPDDAHGMDQQNSPDTAHDPPHDDPSVPRPLDRQPPAPRVPEPGQHEEARPGGPRSSEPRHEPLLFDTPSHGESADEEGLRAMMRAAVRDIQASPDALEHLRRAIPVRRQRRRQAMVGAAAALVLAGMAIPALVRAAGSPGGTAAAPASVASSKAVPPGEDGHTRASGGPSGQTSPWPGGEATKHVPTAAAGGSTSSTPATPSGKATPAPDCSSKQLGKGASSAASPDPSGRVYGWFRVANVSDAPCTVPSGGVVNAVAQGSADPSRIQVVEHTAGDPAPDLPTSSSSGPLVLSPGQDYEVAFAWVPADSSTGGCAPTTTPPASPTPTATATTPDGSDAGTTGSGSASTADAPQSGSDSPSTPPSGSVVLNHTPAPGAPEVDGPVIQHACAGTVYTTSALPDPSGTSGS
jgi:hypothetical protein